MVQSNCINPVRLIASLSRFTLVLRADCLTNGVIRLFINNTLKHSFCVLLELLKLWCSDM